MRLWIAHMNGFTPETWPVVSLPQQGSVINLKHEIDEAGSDTLIAFVGTGGKETDENEQGKLLGLADVYDMPIFNTEEVIDEKHKWRNESKAEHSNIYNDTGKIKWPTGLAIRQGWKFTNPPDAKLESLLGTLSNNRKKIFYNQNIGIGTPWEVKDKIRVKNILELLRGNAIFPKIDTAQTDCRGLPIGPTQGLPPSNGKNQSNFPNPKSENCSSQACTYVLRFAESNCYKIGYTGDLNGRLSAINAHIPFEILDKSWVPVPFMCQDWHGHGSTTKAYDMEQCVLNFLSDKRTYGERVQCTKGELKSAWNKAVRKIKAKN